MRCNFGRLTAAKRHILEDPDLYYTTEEGSTELTELSRAEQRSRRRKVCEKLAMVPGKLDHATVVAYQVVIAIQISEFPHKRIQLRMKRGLLDAKKCKQCSMFSFHGTEETKKETHEHDRKSLNFSLGLRTASNNSSVPLGGILSLSSGSVE